MQLVILGSGTAVPSPTRAPAGYLISCGSTLLLMDCGSGTTGRIVRTGCSLSDIAAVLLSHRHIDHTGDLPALGFAMRLTGDPRTELDVHAGPGMASFVSGLVDAFGPAMTPSDEAEIVVTEHGDSDRFVIGDFDCSTRTLAHDATSVGFRLDGADGASVAYLGDTGPCENAVELCRGVDLAIVECSYLDDRDTSNHLTPRTVAELLDAAQPGAAILTHLYPDAAAAPLDLLVRGHGCTVPVTIGYDGLGVDIGG